jgi:hypothetical protein
MKGIYSLLLAILVNVNLTLAGGSNWPGIKYSYAKVYLYNVDGNLRGNHQILKEGKLDKTIQGEGKKLTHEQTSKLDKIFASGPAIDELVNGLSGCYIPRHAIVYYNEKDEPVASMSICFECEGIRFYSPSYPRNAYASTEKLVKKAQEKLKEIKAIVESIGMKTDFKYTEKAEVKDTILIQNRGTMNITDNRAIDSIFPAKITFENYIKECMLDTIGMTIEKDEKYTYGGDKYVFITVMKGNSSFYFSGTDENPSLETASISWTDVQFSKKLKIGMSLDEIMSFMMVYDGISNPEELTIQNTDGTKKITFFLFENRLSYYNVEVKAW